MPGGFESLDDDEVESIVIGGTVDQEIMGETYEISLKSQKVPMTVAQARMIVDALEEFSPDDEQESSAARKTQRQLRDYFDLE